MRDESVTLDDIVERAERLVHIASEHSVAEVASTPELAESVLYNLIIIGEATKRLSPATCTRFPDVEWSKMAATRDVLVHHYDLVLWEQVDEIMRRQLPPLLRRLAEIRDTLRAEFDAAQG